MNIKFKTLLICIAIPLFTGLLSSFITAGNMDIFQSVNKPSLVPPAYIFPIVWTILYLLMGISSYLVLTSDTDNYVSLKFYALSLFFNFLWPILFFNCNAFLSAFFCIIILWILIVITALLFYQISKPAGYLMIPYILWVTFAGYLNFAIYLMN